MEHAGIRRRIGGATVLLALTVSSPSMAKAGDGESNESGEQKPWIKRNAPRPLTGEIGIYGGLIAPSRSLELYRADPMLPDQGARFYRRVAPEFGGRLGFYPLRFLGFELEGGAMPTRTDDGASQRATLWTFRGHVVAQLGLWSVTPFALLGTGALGVTSSPEVAGNDVDATIHFGGGLKIFVHPKVVLRLDLRDVVSAKRGIDDGVTHTGEFLFGVAFVFGGKKTPEKGPQDSDGDGFLDDEDRCPTVPGVAPHGCPRTDRDGDGFFDDVDACPDERGVEPDGCPRPDRDGDLISDDQDRCPDDPETRNGFEDTDGCPDELPEAVARFSGVIEGIEFDLNKATIRPESHPILDLAAETLIRYDDVRVEIGGHTDSTGGREHNLELSRRRARIVKNYLASKGVDPARITTRGYGPDVPIDSNDTRDGRARNRRVEFVIQK